jgi:hypothetical protein
VATLVARVREVQASQERVARELRGANQVASTVGLDLREAQQRARAP